MNPRLRTVDITINEWITPTPREARAMIENICNAHGNLIKVSIDYVDSLRASKILLVVAKELEARKVQWEIK